jgi:tetratricopeptide (TPR) repeat protein
MKNKILIIAAAILVSASSFAQKDEMKTLKKIYDRDAPSDKDIVEFKETLVKAEPLMATATEADKVSFNYFKATTPFMEMMSAMAKPENKTNTGLAAKYFNSQNISQLATSFAEVLDYEKKSGKEVYTKDITEAVTALTPMLVNLVVALGDKKDYKNGSLILKSLYDLNKKDQEKLYFAANYAINAKDNESAMVYLNELKKLNYTGEGTSFLALNKETQKEDIFNSKAERDLYIKTGNYEKPRDEKITSKRPEILRSIAIISAESGKADETKIAFEDAIANSPEDVSLLTDFAEFYYFKLKDEVNYKKYVALALEKNPNDSALNYNMGLMNLKINNDIEAEKYFKKAIELKPEYADAYLNLAQLKINVQQKYATEMAKLSSNEKDTKRYNFLNLESKKLVNEALPNLEKAYELNPKNEDVKAQLISVYKYLDMMDKAKALKAKMQ